MSCGKPGGTAAGAAARQPHFYRVNLETSSLSGWVGATAAALQPLVDALATHVVASDTLHVDDTGVPVLAPGTGQDQDRLWTHVRDERPFAGARPPAALFCYSPTLSGASIKIASAPARAYASPRRMASSTP